MNKFKHAIIIDEKGKPMVWSEREKQIVYCTTEDWKDEHTPLCAYTLAKANRLIDKSMEYRRKNKLTLSTYKLMPFAVGTQFKHWNKPLNKS